MTKWLYSQQSAIWSLVWAWLNGSVINITTTTTLIISLNKLALHTRGSGDLETGPFCLLLRIIWLSPVLDNAKDNAELTTLFQGQRRVDYPLFWSTQSWKELRISLLIKTLFFITVSQGESSARGDQILKETKTRDTVHLMWNCLPLVDWRVESGWKLN